MTVDQIAKEIETISNSGDMEYSHPNNAARIYQVFQAVGMAVGKRMAELQAEDRNGRTRPLRN